MNPAFITHAAEDIQSSRQGNCDMSSQERNRRMALRFAHRSICRRSIAVVAALTVATLAAVPTHRGAASASPATLGPNPTIVLVHGAWADGSSWAGVVQRLQDDGYTVDAPPNPLRGLASDPAYLADFLKTITGPIVLVGHSYGGAVITNAATGNPQVKALVYVDAFIPDQGESLLQLVGARPGSCLTAKPATVFNFVPYPGAPKGDVMLYLKPNVFVSCFTNGLPASEATVLAAIQRPISFSGFATPSGAPAWKTIPSWSLIGTADKAIPPAELRFMSKRAHAQITEIVAPHLSMVAQPGAVTTVIEQAARATE
jgi:pimeloyl-ACP methyl ester carboxylesterase